MTRREKIRLKLDRIKVTRSLVARLAEFIDLSRKAGYEPVQSVKTLEKMRSELAEQRAALARMTISGQQDFATRQAPPYPVRQRAA